MYPLKRVHLEISTFCNSACRTCPHDKITRQKTINTAIARQIIIDDCLIYQNTIELFEFHNYNEPLLTFDLFDEFASLVKEIYGDYKVGIVSNGSIMSHKIAIKLIRLKLAHIYFSIDGFSKEVFESHRVGLDRDRVYNNVDYFINMCQLMSDLTDEQILPYVSFVITDKNQHEKDLFRDYFSNRHCHFSFQDCDGRGSSVGKEQNLYNIFSEQPCDYALDGIYVLSNLDVVPCCIDWSGIEVMGNLAHQTVQEVVEGNKYQDFRDKHLTGRKREIKLCANCKTNMIYGYPRVHEVKVS